MPMDVIQKTFDFALEDRKKIMRSLITSKAVQADLKAESYQIEVKTNEKILSTTLFLFPGLLHELGLSPMPSETLSIKNRSG